MTFKSINVLFILNKNSTHSYQRSIYFKALALLNFSFVVYSPTMKMQHLLYGKGIRVTRKQVVLRFKYPAQLLVFLSNLPIGRLCYLPRHLLLQTLHHQQFSKPLAFLRHLWVLWFHSYCLFHLKSTGWVFVVCPFSVIVAAFRLRYQR